MPAEKQNKAHNGANRTLTVLGVIFCIILIPILIVNCTMIVKSFLIPDKVPNFGGRLPLIVLTDSMYPGIKSGDLIIDHTVEPEDVKVGDVISFFDPDGNGTSIVTHRVVDIVEDNGEMKFQTKGDNNNTEDKALVPMESLVGVYDLKINKAGHVALFMQTTPGLILCIGVPIVLLVGYDMIRRRLYEKNKTQDTDALLAELEQLRAAQAERNATEKSEP